MPETATRVENEPPDQEQRRRIAEELDTTMLVEAAAGTGKTTSMVGRMVALIREGRTRIDTMAAITFTRKAAAELRARFQMELERAAREAAGEAGERLREALSHIERCFIGTIHSFCARLLRERPIEAGIDVAFQELEGEDDNRLRERAWDEFVADLSAADDSRLEDLHELGLDIDQLRTAFIAFAEYPDVEEWPAEDVELDDLDGARERLRDYLRHMKELIPTFPIDRGTDRLMNTCERMVRLARNRDLKQVAQLLELLEAFERSPGVTQKCWAGGREEAKAERARWEEFAEETARPLLRQWREKRYARVLAIFHDAVEIYHRKRSDDGKLNFQDLLMISSSLMRDNPQVRRYFRRRFTHLLVDEFQDTDPVQAQVMMFLTASDPEERDWRRCRPSPGSLFVVGDPKQSIYRFRRADIVTYTQVRRIIEESGGAVIPLTTNFRTLGDLVEWGNDFFNEIFPDEATEHSPEARPMQVGRETGSGGELEGIRVIEVPAEKSKKEDVVAYDADVIAGYIRAALDERRTVPRSRRELDNGIAPEATPGDFLIVTWTKSNLADYARALQKLGIPHQVSGGSILSQVAELRLLVDCLYAVAEPDNQVALVSVLRGALFGISDADLYSYRRAGGHFSFRSTSPDGLAPETARQFEEAFGRLARYDMLTKQLPAVPAIERIAADLGLPVSALSRPGGDVQAGSMAKAFQMLRAASGEFNTVAELTEYLVDLIGEKVEFDGIPARASDEPVVRLMNLHKVKGLEAPVVFLANPTGKWRPTIGIHIDRSGEQVRGYLGIHDQIGEHKHPLIACPSGWEAHQEEERLFHEAELERLLYVATTRAGTRLVVSRKVKRPADSYWHPLSEALEECDILADPGPREAPAGKTIRVTREEIESAMERISDTWRPLTLATYKTAAAKEISVDSDAWKRPASSGEHGTEWGTVIHILLEEAMNNPGADLHPLAYATVREQGLEPTSVSQALETVESVMESRIWARAASAERRLVEVPFAICRETTGRVPDETGSQTTRKLSMIVKGAIDLAFEETDGWVIVDYKSDSVARDALPDLVAHYSGQVATYAEAWRKITGEPVKEVGLYFTHEGEYMTVEAEL